MTYILYLIGIAVAMALGAGVYIWATRFARMPWWLAALMVLAMLGLKLIGLGYGCMGYFWLRLRGWSWYTATPLVAAPLAGLGVALGVYTSPGASWTMHPGIIAGIFGVMLLIIGMGILGMAEMFAMFRDRAIQKDSAST
jgi:hypothetical protein